MLVTHHHRASLALGRLAARLAGVPVTLVAAHDMDLTNVGGRVLPRWAVATLRETDALVLLAPSQGEYLHREEGVGRRPWSRTREVVIPNGVTWRRSPTRRPGQRPERGSGLPADAFVVGIVARLSAQKAHHVLLRGLREPARVATAGAAGRRRWRAARAGAPRARDESRARRQRAVHRHPARRPRRAARLRRLLPVVGARGRPDGGHRVDGGGDPRGGHRLRGAARHGRRRRARLPRAGRGRPGAGRPAAPARATTPRCASGWRRRHARAWRTATGSSRRHAATRSCWWTWWVHDEPARPDPGGEPARPVRPPGLAGEPGAGRRRLRRSRSSARWGPTRTEADVTLEGVRILRYPLRPAQGGPLGFLREYAAAMFHTMRLALRVEPSAPGRRRARLQPTRPAVPGRPAAAAVGRQVRLRPPRPGPRALPLPVPRWRQGAVLGDQGARAADLRVCGRGDRHQRELPRRGHRARAAWIRARWWWCAAGRTCPGSCSARRIRSCAAGSASSRRTSA